MGTESQLVVSRGREVIANGYRRFLFWGDENVLILECGDSCTTL